MEATNVRNCERVVYWTACLLAGWCCCWPNGVHSELGSNAGPHIMRNVAVERQRGVPTMNRVRWEENEAKKQVDVGTYSRAFFVLLSLPHSASPSVGRRRTWRNGWRNVWVCGPWEKWFDGRVFDLLCLRIAASAREAAQNKIQTHARTRSVAIGILSWWEAQTTRSPCTTRGMMNDERN